MEDYGISSEQLLSKKAKTCRDDEIDGYIVESETTSEGSTTLTGNKSTLNLLLSIFNLMNSSIGAGLISLGYAASVLGTVQFAILLIIVVVMSAFTMDIVCACSKYAGCYEELSREAETDDFQQKIQVCRRDEECSHKRIYSYERIGELLFGKYRAMKYFINFIMLFYLANAMNAYFIIMKVRINALLIFFNFIWGNLMKILRKFKKNFNEI